MTQLISRCLIAALLFPTVVVAGDWQHYGGDAGGQRYFATARLDKSNLDQLEQAFVFRTGDATSGDDFDGRRSNFKATPILIDGTLYFSTGFNRVFAIDPQRGTQRWVFDPKVDFSRGYSEMFTSRGVSAWSDPDASPDRSCSTRILLGTLDARLIAIDAVDGKPCRKFGRRGEIDLSKGVRNFRRGDYSLTSPVTVVNNVIVVGSSVGDNGGVRIDSGIVRGYDARSGKLLWTWDPVPGNRERAGGETWGPNGGNGNGGSNVWSIISADAERDLVFLPTTSPSPDFYGGERPGSNRFANSVVALHARSGELAWDFQVVHHDLWDFDNAAQPLLIDIRQDDSDVPAVVQATKMGHVFTLHRETGEPVFPVEERPVPRSDVEGEVASATQPFPLQPAPLHDHDLRVWALSDAHVATCERLLEGVRYEGIFTPPSTQGTLLFPGNGGGTNWGSMAAHPAKGIAVLALNRLPTVVELIPRAEFDGRRRNRDDDLIDKQYTAQSGTPYGMARFELYNRESGAPCIEGPWGELIALDMTKGKVKWRVPLGIFPGFDAHPEASQWGSLSAGGPMVTSTGLVFIAPRFGHELNAYDLYTGAVLWRGELPGMPTATPMGYRIDGDDYVLITVGGDVLGDEPAGDYVVAFRLGGNGTKTGSSDR